MTADEIIKRWGAARAGHPADWRDVTVDFDVRTDGYESSGFYAVVEATVTHPDWRWGSWEDPTFPTFELGKLIRSILAEIGEEP